MTLRTLFIALLFLPTYSAFASDVVRVKFFPGYPPPDMSVEFSTVEVSRVAPYQRSREENIDRYFSAISDVMKNENITSNWQRVYVDAPFVQVEVTLQGKAIVLSSSYAGGKQRRTSPENEEDERYRRALTKILRLTSAQVQQNFPME